MSTQRAISLVLTMLLGMSSGAEFQWSSSKLGDCIANDTMLGICSRSRNVQCIKKTNRQPIPGYYCRELDLPSKPSAHVPCDVKECSQRCVVGAWSSWYSCDPGCVRPFRYRTRNILWKDHTSGAVSCPTLIERERCAHCSRHNDMFMWQVGKWGNCRQFKTVVVDYLAVKNLKPGAVAASPHLCGPLMKIGKSTRKVRCVDKKGHEVRARKCLNSKDKFGRITQRPEKSKVCRLPCDCHMSEWSQWSGCAQDCLVTEERRTRAVLYPGQLGGKPCGKLVEKRSCDTKTCPNYEWYAGMWGRCETQSYRGIANESNCGHGFHERVVFCVKSSHHKIVSEIQPVPDDRCDPTTKLVSRNPCHIPCQSDCKVSNWQSWEPCSAPCGKAGIKKRRRTVLQPARHGGKECPNLVEMSRCETVQCFSWVIMTWSGCFLSGKCGPSGTLYRLVFCIDVNGSYVYDKKCSRIPKPVRTESCSKPCPYDCALSSWSEWGPCSKSCGILGGVQTRHRKILGYPGTGGASCPEAKNLIESRKCNERTLCETEMNFMWKTGPWSKCEPLATGSCGIFTGIKKRLVHCATSTLNLGNSSFCPQDLKPSGVKPCDVPCSKDCVLSRWEEWSSCSQTCGSGGVQVRKRYVLEQASHGGLQCPLNITNGVQNESRFCNAVPPCYTYKWVENKWKKCELLPQTKSKQTNCGAGYQTRSVSCLRSDQKVVQGSLCLKSLLRAAPNTLKECWIPCLDDCVRSDWSSWSSCPGKCTANSLSYRIRTRQVVNLSPARGGWSTTCPQLTELDFSEKDQCPSTFCFEYKWHEGPWGNCVPNQVSLNCGNGVRERNVLCQRSDKMYVSGVHCGNATKPVSWQNCSVNCSQDCVVSSWGRWSSCSASCGDSIQKRHRTVIKSPAGLGRVCPSLTEKQLCHEIPCTSFKWSADLWNTCKLNTNDSCGNGTQTRKVVCLPDSTREMACLKQAPKPAMTQPCELPCPGDCVLSNWGPWSTCFNGGQGCTQGRGRTIVRKASQTSAKNCNDEDLTEYQHCDCQVTGSWVESEWTTCQLNNTYGPNCGKGLQLRSVSCVGKQGQTLDDLHCAQKNKSKTLKDCHVKCPVDCVLGKWSPWSVCSKDCGTGGMVMRSRNITVPDKNGGRKCPNKSSLVQRRPCNGRPCHTYTLKKGKWSKCYVDGQGCGHGTQSREASCLRSDGKSVSLHYCFEQSRRGLDDGQFQNLDVLQLVLNNISELSISTKRKCIEPCPGNCVLSKWSEWSHCGRNCFQKTGLSYQSRTRVIISNPVTNGKACSPELWQTRTCQPSGTDQCIGAEWKTGAWQKNGTREVWCQTVYGLNVTGACIINNKPSTTQLCDPACSDPNAICANGKCVCKPFFEFFQYWCIPVKGCLYDGHCMFKNTVCKGQRCECREGHVRNTTIGPCIQSQRYGSPTSTTTSPTSTSTSTDSGVVNKTALEEEELQIHWKWIGIGAGILLLMVLLAVGIVCYTRRQRRTRDKKHDKNANPIELLRVLTLKEEEEHRPAKV